MYTKHLVVDQQSSHKNIKIAATLLQAGEVVAFPTETVYGLGADATNKIAVDKIFQAKGRPNDNPLIVHVATNKQLSEFVTHYPPYVDQLIQAFSPGPITYVLKSNGKVAPNVTAGLSTVGIRIPDNDIALELLRNCQLPIAAPSANTSGKPSPTAAEHVLEDMDGKIAAVLDGGPTIVGVESTVVDCTEEVPKILRLGKVSTADIEKVVGSVYLASSIEENISTPRSPGMKYKHYAPDVPLILVNNRESMQLIIDQNKEKGLRVGALVQVKTAKAIQADKIVTLGDNEEQMAKKLYDALRSFKQDEIDIVICESFSRKGIGQAVMDRLERAATKITE